MLLWWAATQALHYLVQFWTEKMTNCHMAPWCVGKLFNVWTWLGVYRQGCLCGYFEDKRPHHLRGGCLWQGRRCPSQLGKCLPDELDWMHFRQLTDGAHLTWCDLHKGKQQMCAEGGCKSQACALLLRTYHQPRAQTAPLRFALSSFLHGLCSAWSKCQCLHAPQWVWMGSA